MRLYRIILLILPSLLFCHDGPHDVIERLTVEIEKKGPTTERLIRRAVEYRLSGKFKKAEDDLFWVLKTDPDYSAGHIELARLRIREKKSSQALSICQTLLKKRPGRIDLAAAHFLCGEAFVLQEKYPEALAAYEHAIKAETKQVDWYLKRSRLHYILGKIKIRASALHKGYKATDSFVLYDEWIDALIDAGETAPALKEIERNLPRFRLKSSWQIRRARVRLIQGKKDEAKVDLEAAIIEISNRIHPKYPDWGLLLDRSLAHSLLGNPKKAAFDLKWALKLGASGIPVYRLKSLLKGNAALR